MGGPSPAGQIALGLHERHGSALTNFTAALERVDADQALQATKDPYVFEFLELAEDARERDLEQALIAGVQTFLLELGTGFAFHGRQKPRLVGDQEVLPRPPLLPPRLASIRGHRAEGRQVPAEFVSKMNFYPNAVGEQLRLGEDRESVGIILCADRDETVAKLG